MKAVCNVCCHHCVLEEGQFGACGARRNSGGRVTAANYGRLTALALDPIEKKPLARFYPGTRILSVGSYGCSLSCPFCQNHEIAAAGKNAEEKLEIAAYSPQELCDLAAGLKSRNNIGIAFTYNEPLVGWEFVRDTAELFHRRSMKTVLVTNGMASQEILEQILPYIDAMNIDLKGFTQEFYRDFVHGDLEMVKQFIVTASGKCHVELTKLIIPDQNDSEEEMHRMAEWIASLHGGKGRAIPLHVSRYFPRYRWTAPATKIETVYRLAQAAREHLDYVYTGNC